MKDILIKTEGLVHTYKTGVTALQGITSEFYKNEIVSIVGQNGSGKTTLVRHFNGLLRPSAGKIIINGMDTCNKSVRDMSRMVGYVFQNPNHQIFCTTVRDELEVAPMNFKFSIKERKECIERVVELMNIGEVLEHHPLTLDYTTKKIITIASVLAFNPEILIMDEPTGGLDEAGRKILTKIINMVHDAGHTVIMISHDMDYVAENSQRVVVMTEGKIIKEGSPTVIFNEPDILKKAQIEPPQITQLDINLNKENRKIALSVKDFIRKYDK